MLKSAIRRKLEKHLNCLTLVTNEIRNIKSRTDTVQDLDSVWHNMHTVETKINESITELKAAIKALPEPKQYTAIELK